MKARFVVRLFFSSLLAVLAAGAGAMLFLPWVYSAEVLDGEAVVVIRAPQGGIMRSLRVEKGKQVRADTIVAEIVATDIQPPDALVARSILYKRVENARFESQRGGLKQILLKPDLRARLALDQDYARFVGEQRRLFRSFQNKLKKATKSLNEERSRLEVQVRGMEREIASLSKRQALLEQELRATGGAELRAEARRNRKSAQRHRKQLKGLQRKVRSNAKALLETTLRVRRQQSEGMEGVRAELNALYARMGLPSNAFDRLGFADAGGQRLRRLIARRAGRVVRVADGVLPGDVVVRGQVLAEILPNGRRSSYRLRLEDGGGVLSSAVAERRVRVRSLRCEDFPHALALKGEVVGGVLSLERSLLRQVDFPAVRKGGRCSLKAEMEGWRGDFVLDFVRQVFAGRMDWEDLRGEETRAILKNFVDKIKKIKIKNLTKNN